VDTHGVSAQVSVTPSDFGEYRFLIPNSGIGIWQARAYAVVATVKNTVANEKHSIEVAIACCDTNNDGCGAAFGFGGLRVDVLTP
jgi:hypothetical protein